MNQGRHLLIAIIGAFFLYAIVMLIPFGEADWMADHPRQTAQVFGIASLLISIVILWIGRKRLMLTIPFVLFFLLLAAVSGPSYVKARPIAQRNACINNLRLIEEAKSGWASFYRKASNDLPTWADLVPANGAPQFLRRPLECPRGGSYKIGSLVEPATCTFSNKGHRLDYRPPAD